jgi:hypothetical protein
MMLLSAASTAILLSPAQAVFAAFVCFFTLPNIDVHILSAFSPAAVRFQPLLLSFWSAKQVLVLQPILT